MVNNEGGITKSLCSTGHALKVVLMVRFHQVYRNNPLEPFAGGAPEQQLRVKVLVQQQLVKKVLHIRHMVEVNAEKSAVPYQVVLPTDRESAGGRDIVEVCRFEGPLEFRVFDGTEALRCRYAPMAGDVAVGVRRPSIRVVSCSAASTPRACCRASMWPWSSSATATPASPCPTTWTRTSPPKSSASSRATWAW